MKNYNLKEKELAGLSAKERKILSSLMLSEKTIFNPTDLVKNFNVSSQTANQVLSRLYKKGWLYRIKRGSYIIIPLESQSVQPFPEETWSIATELYSPSYLSGWTAAEHWDLTEQIFNTIVVFTTSPQRNSLQKIAGIRYRTHQIQNYAFFGIKKLWVNNRLILIADIHKTLIDVLTYPKIGGGGEHVIKIVKNYWKKKEADSEILLEYAIKINRGVLYKRLGYTAELFSSVSEDWLKLLRSRISKGVSKFDPIGPNKGKIITRWLLRYNVTTRS